MTLRGCDAHKLLRAITKIPTANENEENSSFVEKLNHSKGYHVINLEYWILTRGQNVCFFVDPIQILEMHHNISEDKGCYEKVGVFNVGSVESVSRGQGPLDNDQPEFLGVL